MADRQISELVEAVAIEDNDLLVLQQGETAKKAKGKTVKDWVYNESVENFVIVSDTEPTTERNHIWVDPSEEDVVIPTMEDLQGLTAEDISYDGSATHTSGSVGEAISELSSDIDGLDAGDVEYDSSTTYASDTVGAALATQSEKIDFVGETVGFVLDNLITGLSTGYYGNNGVYSSNANFSYATIDVSDIHTLYIDGILHTYTPSQFTAMGVFFDANDDVVGDILTAIGGTTGTFPALVTVPTGAVTLKLNTDYKSTDYQSNITTNLVCYEITDNYTVKLNDLSENGRKLKIIAGVIRNTGTGWEYINDTNHKRINLSSVEVDSNGYIQVNYGFTAKKVISLVSCPDETFAQSYDFGASVGLTYSTINVYAKPVTYGGRVIINNNTPNYASYSRFTNATFDTETGEIKLYHPTTSGLPTKDIYNIGVECNEFIALPGSHGADYISVWLFNRLTGTLVKDIPNECSIYATRTIDEHVVNANNVVSASGNIWIFGVMEV